MPGSYIAFVILACTAAVALMTYLAQRKYDQTKDFPPDQFLNEGMVEFSSLGYIALQNRKK